MNKTLEKYDITADNVNGEIEIKRTDTELVPVYSLKLPIIEQGTLAVLNDVKELLRAEIPIKSTESLDSSAVQDLKKKFYSHGLAIIKKQLLNLSADVQQLLIGLLVQEMLGLGKLEMLLADGNLEEIVINSKREPVWVYHKKYGWLKTNIMISSDAEILNYAASIGRKVGRQITVLNPLMDAHLPTGDRINAVLFPISSIGNTLTIRKFRRKPWVITELIENNTISSDIAALLWLAIQYEMNIIISGGTASGKTTFLNALASFIQPNHRIVSIEEVREIQLPSFLYWVPLTVREPNPEGKGGIEMIDLLVNSLRMRPDRMIVGEIRRAKEAEVLFEAMHTGHSVYATLHADTAEQTYRRMTNPPINIPETMLEALHLIVVCFRDRRSGIRKILQVAELVPSEESGRAGLKTNVLFRWKPAGDKFIKQSESYRLIDELRLHTGMTTVEIQKDLNDKEKILNWMLKNNIDTLDMVGRIISDYYTDPNRILKFVEQNTEPGKLIPKELLQGGT